MNKVFSTPRSTFYVAWLVLLFAIPTSAMVPHLVVMRESFVFSSQQKFIPPSSSSEGRQLILEYPAQIRVGYSSVVRLTFDVGDSVDPVSNLFDTHHVIAEAKFELPGMQVIPSELTSQTLLEGQSVTFYWKIRPQKRGIYRGTVWFYLRFVDKVSGGESRKTVSAQMVEIEAVDFLGIHAGVIRTFGFVGLAIGVIIGYPFLKSVARFIKK